MNHKLLFFCLLAISMTFEVHAKSSREGKEKFVSPVATQITKVGSNREPLYISNDTIIFTSKDRGFNKDPQIYFKDLKSGKEKQLSFQKGHISIGTYDPISSILFFSSSTDEEKESPFVLKKYLDRFPSSVKNDDFFQVNFEPQEIYSSLLDGSQIKRVTYRTGYEGFPAYLKSKDRLYFSSWQSGQLSLYAKSMKQLELAPWKVTQTLGHDIGLHITNDEKLLTWSRFSPDFKSSQILVSDPQFKNIHFLTLDTGLNWSPTWHPNHQSIIYSAKAANKKDFDLYEASVDGKCKRQISSYEGDEFFPTISPNGDKITFSSTQTGKEQIHQINYPPPLSCPPDTAPL